MDTTVATMDKRIGRSGVIAVVVIDDAARAADLGDALVSGGIEAIEVTLRTPSALDAIRAPLPRTRGALLRHGERRGRAAAQVHADGRRDGGGVSVTPRRRRWTE